MTVEAASKVEVEFLKLLDAELHKDVNTLRLALCKWLARFDSDLTAHANKQELLTTSTSLLIQAILLGSRLSQLLRSAVAGHFELGSPFPKKVLPSLLGALEVLKSFQVAVDRHGALTSLTAVHAGRTCAAQIRRLLLPVRAKLEAARRLDDAALDRLAAVTLMVQTLASPPDRTRLTIVQLARHVAQLKPLMREADHEELSDLLWKLQLLGSWQPTLAAATSCDFLFFCARDLLIPLVAIARELPTPRVLHTLLDAVRDVEPLLRRTAALGVHPTPYAPKPGAPGSGAPPGPINDAAPVGPSWITLLSSMLSSALDEEVLRKLALEIETDLRYAQHAAATLGSLTTPAPANVRALAARLGQPALPICMQAVLPVAHVGRYLDCTFYNLTTVSLHDWRTYAEMRAIAMQRYTFGMDGSGGGGCLDFVDPQLPAAACLPGQTMEEGLDVLQIMRNIHLFVRNFRYNLHNQIFVESGGAHEGKHLNTIGIRHVAASIRVHGAGIMNTAVNFTYQYLKRKLMVFSQFLFDDHIKSKLVREARAYRELAILTRQDRPESDRDGRTRARARYPYESAEKLAKDVRKLGDQHAPITVLDQFRILITEIGNAMGYVRMVRAGGVHFTGETAQCLPDLPGVQPLPLPPDADAAGGDAAPAAGVGNGAAGAVRGALALGAACAEAHGLAARFVDGMRSSYDEGANYFEILVNVFSSEIRSTKNDHLRHFFLIVPSLTIAYVDSMLVAKDKLQKKAREAYFTDDGFAMGLAYLLKLLEQNEQFETLYWWDTVQARYAAERTALQEAAGAASTGGRKEDANTLALKRIRSYELEYELLECAFCSARIFFRT